MIKRILNLIMAIYIDMSAHNFLPQRYNLPLLQDSMMMIFVSICKHFITNTDSP